MVFENIFSKEKTSAKTKEKPKILVDYHEKNSLVPSILSKLDCNPEFQHLNVGDYLINDIAIERKTIPDFKTSIISKRLLFQMKELQQYSKSLIILEGTQKFTLYEGVLHENALRGFILSVLLEHKIPIVFTEDEEDTARYLAVLARKTKKTPSSLRQKIPLTPEEQKQFILEGFPGIGPSTAKALLKEFNSLKDIFNAKEKSLEKILKKKASAFKKLLS